MTHKTINLYNMDYFQAPKPMQHSYNTTYKILLLSNKTWKIHLFHRKTKYKGPKNVPKPLLYSHIKYIYLSYPFEWQKTDFNQFFILYHHPQFAQNIFTFFFLHRQNSTSFLENEGNLQFPQAIYMYISRKYLSKGSFTFKKQRKTTIP